MYIIRISWTGAYRRYTCIWYIIITTGHRRTRIFTARILFAHSVPRVVVWLKTAVTNKIRIYYINTHWYYYYCYYYSRALGQYRFCYYGFFFLLFAAHRRLITKLMTILPFNGSLGLCLIFRVFSLLHGTTIMLLSQYRLTVVAERRRRRRRWLCDGSADQNHGFYYNV